MLKKLLTIFGLVLLLSGVAHAQSGTLRGQITDAETGETIPGANVFITELARGAASDIDGGYVIAGIPVGTYNVRVSYLGYQTANEQVTIQAGQETVLDFALESGAIGLDELVVSGYALVNKRELTGSIARVSSSDFEHVAAQNTEAFLQGRAAGVNITTTSGNPGGAMRVTVRGNGSINAASEPLFIVDGVQMSFSQLSQQTSTSPLNSINPSDIESIEVLKDAATAAIYGSQAANGVVLITTKRGISGKTRITARAETGIRTLAQRPDYISTEEYLDFLGEARYHNGVSPSIEAGRAVYENAFANTYFGTPNEDGVLADFDWVDFIFSDGATQKYNVSASGGDSQTRFYVSGGYEDTEGTAYNTNFTRLALRSNIDHQISDLFSTSVNLNLARTTQFGVCQDGNFVNCAPSQAMLESPFSFPYLKNGEYNPLTNFGASTNPAVIKNEVDRDVTVMAIVSNIDLVYRPTNWLNFRGFVGVDYRDTEDNRYDTHFANPGDGGAISYAIRRVNNFNTNLVANMRQTFDGVHNLSGFIGTEYRRDYSESVLTRGIGFPGKFFEVLSASSTPTQAAGTNSEWRLLSYFGNAKYNYAETYYLTVTARYDGHSRFGADTRWGFFPSVTGAWRISQEDFFNLEVLNELKLRGGYGTTGNSNIGNFASRGLYGVAGSYMGQVALTPIQLANVNLGWEEAVEINLGLDYELYDGRIAGSIDLYQKDNKNLLFARLLPTESGFSSITENIGSVRNRGLELEVSTVNLNRGGFMWSSSFNVAFVQNEITELPDGLPIGEDSQFSSLQEGKAIGIIQVPRWAGVNPADGRPMWYDGDGNITYNPVQATDKIEYKDGVADAVGGFGNTFSYKGFTLDAFLQFSFGQWAFASTDYYFTRTPDFWSNMTSESLDRWRKPGDMTYYPRAMEVGGDFPETADYRTTVGTQSIYNASYIRLKNVSLSYNLPHNLSDRLGLSNVSLFASATNLITWTAWPFYDPEVAFSPTDIYNNVTTASYPTERQINAGIEIQF